MVFGLSGLIFWERSSQKEAEEDTWYLEGCLGGILQQYFQLT